MSLETFYGFSFNYIYVAPILVYGFGLFRLLFLVFLGIFFRVYDRYGLNALVYALTLVSFAAFLVFASDLNILELVFS